VSGGVRVRAFEPGDRERWDAYVRGTPGSGFGHLSGWKTLVEETYACASTYWLAEEDGRVRGILPLFLRTRRGHALFSAPGGLLADDDATAAALLEPARERVAREGLDYLELRDQAREWPGLVTSGEHCTLVLDLAASEEAQWSAFDSKLRNQVRKGQKSGFTIGGGRERLAVFHRVMLENLRDLGTPLRGRRYFERALELVPDSDLLVLERGGEPAAGMFLIEHRDTAYDPWASARRRLLALCPNQVLYWEAIRRAIAHRRTRFDLGRSQWNSGTFLFKAQWGATPRPLFYQYVMGRARALPTLEDQKRGYDLAVRAWKRLPLWAAERLGEPVKRLFPEVV
jgi:FemAB-related protein (PEP-CTERM system-associated)